MLFRSERGLRPVTADRADGRAGRVCVFVDEDHRFALTLAADRAPLGRADTTVAGHPAYRGKPERMAYDVALGEADEHGSLLVGLQAPDGSLTTAPAWFAHVVAQLADRLLS